MNEFEGSEGGFIPFDLTKLDKYPVVTRTGKEIKQLTVFAADDTYRIVGVVDNSLKTFDINGRASLGREDPCDLVMVVPEYTYWVNIYPPIYIDRHSMNTWHTSKEDADDKARDDRVKCVKLKLAEKLKFAGNYA